VGFYVGLYFAEDFNLPPVNEATNNPPDLAPRLSAPRERRTEFLTGYEAAIAFSSRLNG
jgi:hypothetical protein